MDQPEVLAFPEAMKLLGPGGTTRIERRKVSDRAWQQYVVDGVMPEGISDEIAESWLRVRESYGIDPALKQPKRILTPDALEDRRLHDGVLALAAPVLRDFAGRLGLTDHVLAFFDREGFMLSLDGDPGVVEGVRDIAFVPGVNWAEDSAGTNGPGTALASGKPVEVCASEHYVAAWQPWSCAAAPVHAPGEAAPVGLVDITGPWEVRRRQAILIAQAIARAIEERIRAACCVRDEVVRHAFRAAHGGGDALVALDAAARVIAANDAAARRSVIEAGALPATLRHDLFRALQARRPGGDPDVRLELDGREVVATVVEYDRTMVGAILRAPAVTTRPAGAARARGGPMARYEFSRILGRSDQLREAVEIARKASRNDLPAVVFGESGTGKELFAHAIHAASGRQGGPFVPVNCGSIPAQLVEAELFGYEAGTFTGARREGNPGRFEDASGGTLFLDEVSELPLPAQTALLRVLQEREVVRLGGSTPRRIDVRVVAATNKPLEAEVRAGRFRRDLYYRLNVLPIRVPPLRERGDDVEYLALVFLAEAEAEVGREKLSLAADAVDALRAHAWPGNVRELKNVILRAAATAPGAHIRAEDLMLDLGADGGAPAAPGAPGAPGAPALAPLATGGEPGTSVPSSGTLRDAVSESERAALLAALEACEWNVVKAAQRLHVSRMTLYRRLHKLGISRAPAKSA
jgi:transcriptional regulator of acetoin/glycerol metabolism